MRNTFLFCALIWALGACVPKTEFHGSPRVSNGRSGCEQVCSTHGMVLGGMVSMGDQYTDGCICLVPNQPGTAMVTAVAAAPAVTGVVMQTRDDEEAAEEQRRRDAAARQ